MSSACIFLMWPVHDAYHQRKVPKSQKHSWENELFARLTVFQLLAFLAKSYLKAYVSLIFYQGISQRPSSYFGLQAREQWENDNINCFLILFIFVFFFPLMFWEMVEFQMRQHTEYSLLYWVSSCQINFSGKQFSSDLHFCVYFYQSLMWIMWSNFINIFLPSAFHYFFF